MTTAQQALLVATGGAAGAVVRFVVARVSASTLGTAFPYGTLIVNGAGSLVLGLLTGLVVGRDGVPAAAMLLFGVGFCGAFTTFSTFTVDTLLSPTPGLAILNVVLNNLVSLALAAVGLYVGMRA